ncbi:MAG: hypothetical protein AAGJ35_07655 [Myxococcota bacterium]
MPRKSKFQEVCASMHEDDGMPFKVRHRTPESVDPRKAGQLRRHLEQ